MICKLTLQILSPWNHTLIHIYFINYLSSHLHYIWNENTVPSVLLLKRILSMPCSGDLVQKLGKAKMLAKTLNSGGGLEQNGRLNGTRLRGN